MPGWQDFTSFSQQYLSNDLLLDDLTGILNTSLTYFPVIEHGSTAISVSLTAQTAGAFVVTVTDATGIVPTWSQSQVSSGFGDVLQWVPPYSYTTASALKVVVKAPSNQVVNCPTFIFAYGGALSGQQGIQLVRPDGREYPSMTQAATGGTGGAGGGTLVAAPGAGVHILVGAINIQATTNFGALSGTIGGTVVSFAGQGSTGGPAINLVYPSGLLLDANTALAYTAGAASAFAVMYDLVT